MDIDPTTRIGADGKRHPIEDVDPEESNVPYRQWPVREADLERVPLAREVTADAELVVDDAGRVLEVLSGSAVEVTIPAEEDVAFPVGTVIQVARMGAGAVEVAAAAGVTTQSVDGNLAIADRYGVAVLRYRGDDTWHVVGSLA